MSIEYMTAYDQQFYFNGIANISVAAVMCKQAY
jgi:hypothetical protein